MSVTPFEVAAVALETASSLDTLEARGTLRLALRNAGLDAKTARVSDLLVVVEKLLPAELAARGVDAAASVCTAVRAALKAQEAQLAGTTEASPADILRRIRGR